MKKKLIKRFMAASLTVVTIISSTGCSSIIGGAEDLPLVPALTSSELRDYYAEGLKYDSIVSRNNEVHETNYVLRDVSDEKAAEIKELTNDAQDILSSDEYELNEDNLKIVSEDTYNYIKAFLNDKCLNGGDVTSIKGALGYYFVDVDYTLAPRGVGEYKPYANLVGIHGAFYQDAFDNDKVDSTYLINAANKINEYYLENKIFKEAEFDPGTATFSIKDVDQLVVEDSYEDSESTEPVEEEVPVEGEAEPAEGEAEPARTGPTPRPVYTGDTEVPEETETNTDEASAEDETPTEDEAEPSEGETEPEEDETKPEEEFVDQAIEELDNVKTTDGAVNGVGRRVQSLPANIVNSVAGSSFRQSAYMPSLDLVYENPGNEGTIGGIGLYSTGTDGLTLFGFDKAALTGKVTLRYIFKETCDGTGEIIGTNIYPTYYELTSGITVSNNENTVPAYVVDSLEQLIERSDRAIVNNDLASLVSGIIYADMGVGMLRGYESQSTNVLKHMSTIRNIISRDIENNAYLIEVETTRQEGPKDVDLYGTYRDKYYMVIEQVDDLFYITDSIMASRTVNKHPDINPDSAAKKRLTALNLTGEVTEDVQKEALALMDALYTSGNYKILRGPKTVGKKEIQRGMYDCFNENPEMLSSDLLEYYNSSFRDLLSKYGTNVDSSIYGTVTEWIGGTDNQVEFTTEELIIYKGRNTAVRLEKYYLISCMEDKWVIDEMTILNDKNGEEVSGGDIDTIKSRIGADKFMF